LKTKNKVDYLSSLSSFLAQNTVCFHYEGRSGYVV